MKYALRKKILKSKKFIPIIIFVFLIFYGIISSLQKKFERLDKPIFNNNNVGYPESNLHIILIISPPELPGG